MDNMFLTVQIDLSHSNVLVAGNDDRADIIEKLLMSKAGTLTRLRDSFKRDIIFGMDVVISSSTDSSFNDELFAVCRTLGVRICIMDQPQRSDFIIPAESLQPDFIENQEHTEPTWKTQSLKPEAK